MNKKLMILGASLLQIPAIESAKSMGVEVIAVDYDKDAPGFKIADKTLNISTIDAEAVLEAASKIQPDGIMTLASDMPMTTVALVGEKLNLNTVSLETAKNTTNKVKMRMKLRESNVAIPNFEIVRNLDEAKSKFNDFIGGVIIKPADNSGSRGVSLVNSIQELEEAFLHAEKHSRSSEVLMEDFMQGPEVSVETIAINGEVNVIAITDKLTTGAPHFIEMGHSIPSRLPQDIIEQIKKLTIKANKALEIFNGPSHTEIIITNDGPKIVEVGARLGGDNITTHLVPLATGINLVDCCVKLALGEEITFSEPLEHSAAIRFITTKPGRILEMTSLEDIDLSQNVKQLLVNKTVGEMVESLKSSNDRIGYVISTANNVQDAIACCEEVVNKLKIKICETEGK